MNKQPNLADRPYSESERSRSGESERLNSRTDTPVHASLQFRGPAHGTATKMLLVVLGSLFVLLGIIGIALPLVPTTPFLLLAAVCYARSSGKCYHWLFHHKWFGEYLRNYRDGKGIPLKVKVSMLAFLWLTISLTAGFIVDVQWLQIMLVIITAAVTVHMCYLPTFRPETGARKEKQNHHI